MLVALAALLAVWLVAGYVLIIRPTTDRPARVDAIFVLGPPSANGRFELGRRLIAEGYAKNLVVSANPWEAPAIKQACRSGLPTATVTCYFPQPTTTQGEARKIRQMADEHGWHDVMVVTSRYHVSRARLIINRCYSGRLLMVAADGHVGLHEWGYEFLYQTGAFAKALTHTSC